MGYMATMGINEIEWAKAYAKPQINVCRSIDVPDSPDDYISLLERYLQLVPYITPGPTRTTLSHRDLHLDNIFVDPDTKKITCVIDWQSTSVSEPFFQQVTPRMLLPVVQRYPGERSEAVLGLSNATEDSSGTAELLSRYQTLMKLKNKERWEVMNLRNRSLLIEPVSLVCGAWSRNDVFSFRHALIHVMARWKDIAPATKTIPVRFTKDALELHSSELELLEGLGEVLYQLQDDNLIPLGGMVLRENYEQAVQVNNKVREMFVEMAESASQRNLYSKLWPYQDLDP